MVVSLSYCPFTGEHVTLKIINTCNGTTYHQFIILLKYDTFLNLYMYLYWLQIE